MWATTSGGRVFVTFNANDSNPAAVVWNRIDQLPTSPSNPCPSGTEPNCSPDRIPTGIYPDPSNPRRAYITYTGYNASTPATPGHLYRVTLNGAGTAVEFLNLNVEAGLNNFPNQTGTGDLPANDVVMDDLTGNLYVATDFGVLKGTPTGPNTFGWATTTGMPRYIVAHLALVGGQRDACRSDVAAASGVCGDLLLAATHSQGIWLNRLG
jgi:hypothetical protein